MTAIRAAGTLLKASVASRVLEYLLLPFGEEGRTSAGRVTASAGSVTIPENHIIANIEHDSTRPVATSIQIDERAEGLVASFTVLPTTAGNDLLVEADTGVRPGISVEIENPVIRAGKLLAGTLTGAGFVTKPAFPSALMLAADAGELPDEIMPDTNSETVSTDEIEVDGVMYVRKTTSTYVSETVRKDGEDPEDTTDPDAEPVVEPTAEDQESTVTASTRKAAAPAGLTATRTKTAPATEPQGRTLREMTTLLAAYAGTGDRRYLEELADDDAAASMLFAALNDVKYDGTGAPGNNMRQPAWLGELWSGKQYVQRIIPLLGATKPLESLEMTGFQWLVKPTMAPWAGNKSAVPSNTPTTKKVDGTATRYAGAHDHAREYRDFPNPLYWESYFRAMTESYAELTDRATAAALIAAATPVESGVVPVGASEGLVKVVDGVLSMLDFARPSFALLAPDLWRGVLLTPQDKALEYLTSSMGLEEGDLTGFKLRPWSALEPGQVAVGAAEAADVYELPGSPIRVEALDMVKGGVDTGLFGYHGTMINDARGLALVTSPAPIGG